ncbi:hypothetical protein YC2023_038479 [Brassica napus]
MPRNMVCNGSTLALWPLHITQSSLTTWGKVTSIVSVPEGRRGPSFHLDYLVRTTPSSNCYKDFTTDKERIPQVVFAEFSILALFCSPYLLVDHPDHDVWLYMSYVIHHIVVHRWDSYVFIYLPSMAVAMIPIGVYWMFALSILLYNFCSEEFSINSSDSPLPA